MQGKYYRICASWDDESRRFTVTSEDIPGLILETDTIPEIFDLLEDVLPDLLDSPKAIKKNEYPITFHTSTVLRAHA